ncbi:hypothetical protein [Actinomadura atramentaria]|uniref:hypothetical protein n=1 Tax=Actinomadura atramentaria TaxID=1990 RepID=UPI00036F092A|nr:hypothetical protein [Actinomadura atramentaria]
MFEIWETGEPARLIAEARDLDLALEKVDTMCRLRHDQAVAQIEDGGAAGYRFEIRDGDRVLARLAYVPDTTRPYRSVVTEELRSGNR